MSWVTTVVVASNYLSDDDKQYIKKAVADYNRAGATLNEPNSCGEAFGGSKCAEADVLLGAFNYLNVDEFLATLKERKFFGGIYVLAFSNGEFVYTYMQDTERHPDDVGGDFHVVGGPAEVAMLNADRWVAEQDR